MAREERIIVFRPPRRFEICLLRVVRVDQSAVGTRFSDAAGRAASHALGFACRCSVWLRFICGVCPVCHHLLLLFAKVGGLAIGLRRGTLYDGYNFVGDCHLLLRCC